MSALTSLLARDQVVPVRKIEEALQKQVVSGGEISSVLLELDALPENTLAAYCAALYGALPATREEVMRVSRDVIRQVPREIAERHRLIPLAREDRSLVVAMAHPLPAEAREQLGFLWGLEIVVRIVCDVRVSAGLVHHYAGEVSPRHRRLIDRLRERDAGPVPYVVPPREGRVDRSALSLLPAKKKSAGDWLLDDDSEEGSAVDIPSARPLSREPEPQQRVQAIEPAPSVPPPASAPRVSATQREPAPEPSATSRALRRLRGPLTAAAAVKLLVDTTERDEIVQVFFAYARQFFDYAALFVLHDEMAHGRDAFGSGASSEAVRRIAVPLDVPGTFSEVRRSLEVRVGTLDVSELDRLVLRDLGRAEDTIALVLPVAIRGRAVLLFYGDRSGDEFFYSELPELIAFLPRVAEAFESLILRKKRAATSPGAVSTPGVTPSPSVRPGTGPGGGPPETEHAPGRQSSVPPGAPPSFGAFESERPRRESDTSAQDRLPHSSRPSEVIRHATQRPAALRHMLGIPRDAPPPPEAQVRIPPASERPPPPPIVVPASTGSSEPDDEPELSVGESDDPPEFDEPSAPEFRGSYRLHPSPTIEVIRTPRSVLPPSDEPDRAGALPRRAPPRSSESIPTVIVDMGDHINALVTQLTESQPEHTVGIIETLVQMGEAALPTLAQAFPGPLWFDRRKPHRRLPQGRDVSAVARALFAFRERAAPYVASLLDSTHADRRFYALLLASEFVHSALVRAVAERVFDDDEGIRVLAQSTLERFATITPAYPDALTALRRTARIRGRELSRRCFAVAALGGVHDVGAARMLIELLDDENEQLAEEARRALVEISRDDHGLSSRRWTQWLERNQDRHRIEWLIDGLTHSDESIRQRAGDELKSLTQQYYGYHPTSPKREREVAQQKYRKWWSEEGRTLYQRG